MERGLRSVVRVAANGGPHLFFGVGGSAEHASGKVEGSETNPAEGVSGNTIHAANHGCKNINWAPAMCCVHCLVPGSMMELTRAHLSCCDAARGVGWWLKKKWVVWMGKGQILFLHELGIGQKGANRISTREATQTAVGLLSGRELTRVGWNLEEHMSNLSSSSLMTVLWSLIVIEKSCFKLALSLAHFCVAGCKVRGALCLLRSLSSRLAIVRLQVPCPFLLRKMPVFWQPSN